VEVERAREEEREIDERAKKDTQQKAAAEEEAKKVAEEQEAKNVVEEEEAKKVVAEEEAKKVVAEELQAKRKELVSEQQVQIYINAYTHTPTRAYIYVCKSELYMDHTRKGWGRRESHQRCWRERVKKEGGLDRDQSIGWLRIVGSLKLQVSFAKGPNKRDYSAKETYNFKDSTNRSHPISSSRVLKDSRGVASSS